MNAVAIDTANPAPDTDCNQPLINLRQVKAGADMPEQFAAIMRIQFEPTAKLINAIGLKAE